MQLGQHSDAELMRLAKAGWASAFAVLVYRHAPLVHAALREEPDPLTQTTAVFVHAMRELRTRDAAVPVGPWLLELIDRPPPAQPSALSSEELDAVWRELHHRWPDGDRPATTWPWRGMALVAGLVVVAAAVPALVLGIDTPQESEVELRAVPVTEERREVEAADEDGLPSFSFPVAPQDETGTDPGSGVESDPEPQPEVVEPEAEREPEAPASPPPNEPTPEPQPEPEPQPDAQEPDPEPSDDSPPLEELLDPNEDDAAGAEGSASDDTGGDDPASGT